ncbi:response regulator [Vibrio astriarenae]|jgi:two-component system chemotaxis response regulator CheY|uniref:Response regulator n=1 Tax=Vibrio agarivorans TaxID=153622 RepID=A0ABT7XZ35_9VIBR|nr:response regulator [Vibrio agarivorans]MDN2481045.1 response regulator [Vibrio agarivorans]MDN3663250.1 response regulator [Vibrio agarivorans]
MESLYVICVDDQREVLSAVVADMAALSDWLTIEDCESADEAFDLMEELDAEGQHIAVVISDHVMPDKTGVELLKEIHLDGRFTQTKKVLLTGQATHSDTIEAINDAGVEHYFEKPWDAEKLVNTVRVLATKFVFDSKLDHLPLVEHLDPQTMFTKMKG